MNNVPVSSPDVRRLVPLGTRWAAGVITSLCAVLLVALAVRFHGQHSYTGIDGMIVRWLPSPGSHQRLLTHVADAVPPAFFLLVVVLVVVGGVRRDGRLTALAVIGPGLSMLVTEGGKRVVGRTIDGWLALPSGHTTGVTSVSLVAACLLLRVARLQTGKACIAALGAVTLAGLAIGVVMVVLHFHYPTDIAAGWAAALACTLGSALAIDLVAGDRRLSALAIDRPLTTSTGNGSTPRG